MNSATPTLPQAPCSINAGEQAVLLENCTFCWPGQQEETLRIPLFCVGKGETVFLSGPSGGGKSTLLSLIAGILQPASGNVRVNGIRVGTLPRFARDSFRGDTIGLMRAGKLRRTLPAASVTAQDLEALYLEEMAVTA